MDLGLQDRAIWLLLGSTPAAWRLAESCLEEGACVALFSGDTREGKKPRAALAQRFGLRVRVAGCDDSPSLLDAAPADLLLWAGRPAAIIALCADPAPDVRLGSDWAGYLRSCVATLQPGGGLVLVETDWDLQGEADGIGDPGLMALQETRLVWQALAPEGVRVSVVGAPGLLFEPLAPGRREDALVNLVLFLAGRGFGSLAAVGADGAIRLF